jgi:hypothetical protein
VAADEDVFRLQVAMHDAALVCGGQCACDLGSEIKHDPRRERAFLQALAQGLTLEQLGDDKGDTIVRAHVVDRKDVRVIESRGRVSFLLKALQARRVLRDGRRQYLDGHLALELRVVRAIHLAHPALANLRADFVTTQKCAGGDAHQNWLNPQITQITQIKTETERG